jgi:uncharacterized protein with beta-barrel porin domain
MTLIGPSIGTIGPKSGSRPVRPHGRGLDATALTGGAVALWLAMAPMLATPAVAADGDGGASGGANPVGAGATGFIGNAGGTGTDAGAVAGGGGGTGGGGGGAGGGTGGNGGNAANPLSGIGQGGAAGQPGTTGSLSDGNNGGGQGGGGGGGGGGLNGSTSASMANTTPLAGGDGGAGGKGGTFASTTLNVTNVGGGGGGGGAGGYGAVVTGSAIDSNTSSMTGGNGGAGGNAQVGPAFGGNGGAGGTAAAFVAAGVTLTNSGTVQGGNGGNGGAGGASFFLGGNGGNGGTGGAGVAFLGAGAALTNNSLIQGGNGGNGGNLGTGQFSGANGNGGTGGTGVAFQASGGTLANTATIRGGNGGSSGTPANVGFGGVGVSGSGLTITNSGTIAGGFAGDGVTRANAITFTGGVNSLTLLPGSSITGNVAAFSAADTLTLGGSGNGGALNAARYQGFGFFNKTGTSTWTLITGASSPATPWVISGGVLTAGNTTNVFGATSLITVNAPGTLDLGGFSQTIGSLTGSGTVTNSGATFPATLTTGGDNTSTTFSGTIQNGNSTLSLTKEGSGVFTLSGTNTYTGATTVNAGTLALTGNGSIGSSSGVNVANTGSIFDISGTTSGASITNLLGVAGGSVILGGKTLTLSNASGTFDGAIGGAGGGLALTAGSETLTGTNTYTGPTTINGGTLLVNGSIAPSATFVNAGGTLAGTGTVGNVTVHAGGILAPGPTGAPGSLAVSGNLAFASGAIYLVNVTSANASAANVSGVATLTGGSVRTAFSAGTQMGTSYTILTSSGLVGTFSGLSGNVPAGFIETLSYIGNTVVLNVTTTLGGTGTPGNGGQGGGNQQNVTNTLVSYFNNGGMLPPALVAMFGLTGNDLKIATSLLSGEAATGAQSSAFLLMTGFLGLLTDPFVEGRGGGGNAIGFATEDATLPPEIASAYAAVFKAPPRQAPPFAQRWNIWGSAFGGANHTDGNAVVGSHDLTASAGGFAAGADYRVTPFTTVGFALAGAGTGWSLAQGLGTGQSDALMAGIYGSTTSGPAYVAASLAFANHWMSTDRISFAADQLTTKFNAQSYGGRLEAGYRFASPLAAVTPYAAVNAQAFVAPSYNEQDLSGGGLGLAFAGRTASDIRGEGGARFDRLTAIDPTTLLVLRGKLGYAHDWVSNPSLAAVFQALPGTNFIVNGAAPAHDSGLVAAGAELRFSSGISLAAKFDGEFATHSQTYAGTGTVRYSW